jgi:DNA polymerase-3 subunit gamma/tau
MDVFEIDAASNRGIDEIRELRETIKFAPAELRYKVYIIDEVHMLTTEAFNALLKTLEEPPAHVVFILATTEPHKIPATIHSRCQRYDFKPISARQIEERLTLVAAETGAKISAEALKLIAVKADGGMRDALSILDQCLSFDREKIEAQDVRALLGLIGHDQIWSITSSLLEKDAPAVLTKINESVNQGQDARQLLLEITLHLRSLMLYKAAPELENLELYSEDREILAKQSSLLSHAEIVQILNKLHEAANDAKWAQEPRIEVEMALISLCRRADSAELTSLAARIAALEQKLAAVTSGGVVAETARPAEKKPVKEPVLEPIIKEPAVKKTADAPKSAAKPTPIFSAPPPSVTAKIPQAVPAVASTYTSAELAQIWADVLKEVSAAGKRSLYACIMQGRLVKMNDKVAQIEFTTAFTKERTEKDDFRSLAEKFLAQVTGQPRNIVCTLAGNNLPPLPEIKTAEQPFKPPQNEQPTAVQLPAEQPGAEEHPALLKAREMFGGKVEKINT